MPLLITITSGGTHRVSNEGLALEHYWDSYVVSFDPPQYGTKEESGGEVVSVFGSITLSPEMFGTSQPPITFEIDVRYTPANTEVDAQLVFSGVGHLESMTRKGNKYGLYRPAFEYEVPATTVFNDTLVNVVSWFCDAARLNLTLNSTEAKSPSPAVSFTQDSEILGIDLLSDICAAYCHMVFIEDGTLYLIDRFLGGIGGKILTEFDFLPIPAFTYRAPWSAVYSDDQTFEVATTYHHGERESIDFPYHDQESVIAPAWYWLAELHHAPCCKISLPMHGELPKPGYRLVITDDSYPFPITAEFQVNGIRYDFDNEIIECDCDGAFT